MRTYVEISRCSEPDTDTRPEDVLFRDPSLNSCDYARTMAWYRGAWGFLSVYARALVTIPHRTGNISFEIRSPGISGVPDDKPEIVERVKEHEERILRDMLVYLRSDYVSRLAA